MRATTSSASAGESPAAPGGEAASGEPGSFERILGPERGAAYRRFLEWSVGGGFMLAVVEIRRPAQREALGAATGAAVPGLCVARLVSVGARPVRTLLEEVCPSSADTSVLMLTHLEEAHDAARICAELNVHRDELARRFALPWVLVVHPVAALALQRDAPDFCDFAGLWLPEEPAERAEPLLDQVLGMTAEPVTRFEPPDPEARTSKNLLALARDAIRLGRFDEALDLLAQYDLSHPEARTSDAERIGVEGLLLRGRGRFAEAVERLEAALSLYKVAGDRRMEAAFLNELVRTHMLQGDLAAALPLQREVLDIIPRDGSRSDLASSQLRLAIMDGSQESRATAADLVRESLKLSEQMDDRGGRASSLFELALLEELQGNDATAAELLRESLKLSEQLGDREWQEVTTRQLAVVEAQQGNDAVAREWLRHSLKLSEELGNLRGSVESLLRLAKIERRQGCYVASRELLRRSLKLSEEMGEGSARIEALQQLAMVAQLEGHFEEASDLLRESLELSEKLGARAKEGVSLFMLGKLLAAKGQRSLALVYFRKAAGILAELGITSLADAQEALGRLEAG
ncbi:tetratricopeptide repeat protein [Sorangium sp. So ce269]